MPPPVVCESSESTSTKQLVRDTAREYATDQECADALGISLIHWRKLCNKFHIPPKNKAKALTAESEQHVEEILAARYGREHVKHQGFGRGNKGHDIELAGLRIDVKASRPKMIRPHKYPYLQFNFRGHNSKKDIHREYDFIICVGYTEIYVPLHLFIIPVAELKAKVGLLVCCERKHHNSYAWKYVNAWGPLDASVSERLRSDVKTNPERIKSQQQSG